MTVVDPIRVRAAIESAGVSVEAIEDATYDVAGMRPSLVASPGSPEEMAAVMKIADGSGVAAIPWGGGTRMTVGLPPRRAELVVKTTGLDEIIEYEPADLTVTVQAGITLGALQARLAREGQFLALDPAAADRATIGGLIAANASGPLRFMYGAARDLVIGTRVVNADGIISKAGGRVVKNVAGYDLNKLYIGSLGTVGIVVELSFKLHPLPQVEGFTVAAFQSLDDAEHAANTIFRSPLGASCIELLNASAASNVLASSVADGYVLIVGAGGFEKAVQRQLREFRAICEKAAEIQDYTDSTSLGRTWSGLREHSDPSSEGVTLLKMAVPPSRSARALACLADEASKVGFTAGVQAHAGTGVAYARILTDGGAAELAGRLATLLNATRAYASGEGGSLVVEACPAAAREGLDVWGDPGDGFPIMKSLKERLDPNATLNPGRFVRGL
ncbi:MAG: FAD-binding oxidoreductase [Chloroflexota bacterium]